MRLNFQRQILLITKTSPGIINYAEEIHTCTPLLYTVLFLFQINNPDMRVVILKDFVKANFPSTPLLDYAIEVEKITTSKVKIF